MNKYRFLLILVIVWATAQTFCLAQDYVLKKVEPPFWFCGMKHRQLQIMIHGNRVGELEPEFRYPGIETDSIVRVQNPNYLFIYLNISNNTLNGSFQISLKKNGETKVSYLYKLESRKPGSADRAGFNNFDAIYLVTPDRFSNGDPRNDDIPGMTEKSNRADKNGRHGGDLRGVINHLDYIADMKCWQTILFIRIPIIWWFSLIITISTGSTHK